MKKILFLLLIISPLYAQETSDITDLPITTEIVEQALTDAQTESETAKLTETDTANEEKFVSRLPLSEIQRIEMELKTSTLSEIAVWARILGLSEGGTRDELARRIRNHFQIPEPAQGEKTNQKIITIESAQTTDYFSIDVINEDYARLRGDVNISLKDGDSIHKIKAHEILFNRTRNILSATGNVIYEKVDSSTTETFRGESITVNLDNWSSIFLDGNSTMKDGDTSYRFSGKIITRTDQDVTILSNAKITSGESEETFWSITATRLWLLPGSDFAIANAVLKVGEIPVLYIPFFYFPTDQLIFHPVIGYRSREGGFVQTTTYILGQPKAETNQESSLSRILGSSSDSQLEREGIFLRSTGKKIVNPNELSLKAMVDYYVNMGLFAGVDLAVPSTGILSKLNFNFGLGFTRTVTPSSGGAFTPYAPGFDGTFQKNHSNLFSISVPFRYMMGLDSSISGKYGSFEWKFPYHSDPFVNRDFINNRAESMDWAKMLMEGAASEEETLNESQITPYTWTVTGKINTPFAKLSPYFRMSAPSLNSALAFKSIEAKVLNENGALESLPTEDPGRIFYAPDRFTIYSITTSFSGNPLTLGGTKTASGKKSEKQTAQEPLLGIGTPIPPWSESEAREESTPTQENLIPPVLRQTFSIPNTGKLNFSLDYTITPSSVSVLQFMNEGWNTFEKVDWSQISTILTSVSGDANIKLNFNHTSGLFSNTVSFRGEGSWRDYSFLNEDAFLDSNKNVDTAKIEKTYRDQYSQTNYRTGYSYSGSLKPFFRNLIFGATKIDYSFAGTLVRSKKYKEGESPADGPELSPVWGAWVKDEVNKEIYGLSGHSIGANINALLMEKNQTLTFNATLPPLDESFNTSMTLRFWLSETHASFNVVRITESTQRSFPEKALGEWGYRPITLRETLNINSKINFNYNMTIDPEKDFEVTNINSTLKLWNFNANFTASRLVKVDFIQNAAGGGWVNSKEEPEPSLRPSKLDLSYAQSFNNIGIVRNLLNLTFSINTSLSFDLYKFTNSNFMFSFGFTLKIKNFLDITLSASSENKVIARYFKIFPGMDHLTFMYPEGDQNKLFTDLWHSFSFWDKDKRLSSGFKMRTFGLTVDHFMGDWTATLTMNMSPHRDLATMDPFKIIVDFSFIVQWKPIKEIRTGMRHEGKTEKWSRVDF